MNKNSRPRPRTTKQNSRHPARLLTAISACWKKNPLPDSIPVMQGWVKLYETVLNRSR